MLLNVYILHEWESLLKIALVMFTHFITTVSIEAEGKFCDALQS